jgi:hypothetical protein
MMTPEGRVKVKLKKHLARCNYYQFWPVQTGYGAATVDCLACYDGRFRGIECKAPGKQLTPRQLTTMREIRKAGGETWLVTMGGEEGALIWTKVTD